MNKITLPALALAAFGLTAGTAFAQTPTTFADLDADANGELSIAELQVAWPDLTQAEFDGADLDVSGGMSVDELNSVQGAAAPAPMSPVEPMAPADPMAPAGSLAPAEPLAPTESIAPTEEPEETEIPESIAN